VTLGGYWQAPQHLDLLSPPDLTVLLQKKTTAYLYLFLPAFISADEGFCILRLEQAMICGSNIVRMDSKRHCLFQLAMITLLKMGIKRL
jgi:hypothetical protein